MASLGTYLQDTQRLLREQRQELLNPEDLVAYINRARREIAGRAQCIRVLTPISGQITNWTLSSGGTGYTAPTLTITPPDFPSGLLPYPMGNQATATATVVGGVITAITDVYGGDGYFQPQMTITDTTGSGAAATPTLTFINELNVGQEVYPFSGINLSANPGCKSVYYVRSISIIYNNYRYSLPVYAFSIYQAMIRQYPFQYQYVPTFASQFGQGTQGSFYVYPLPSQTYQYELDCLCLPWDLTTALDYEAIPDPWTDAVAWYACHLAMVELKNFNAAKFYLDLYEKFATNYSQYARVGRVTNPYGRF
jgi:hypothetical protein